MGIIETLTDTTKDGLANYALNPTTYSISKDLNNSLSSGVANMDVVRPDEHIDYNILENRFKNFERTIDDPEGTNNTLIVIAQMDAAILRVSSGIVNASVDVRSSHLKYLPEESKVEDDVVDIKNLTHIRNESSALLENVLNICRNF